MKCTGYFSMVQDLPPEEKSEAADKGTLFHEMMEISLHDFLMHKVEGTDPDVRAHLIAANPDVDDEMINHIQECKKLIWDKGLDKHITGKAFDFETVFSMGTIGDIELSGSIDFWCVYKDKKGRRAGLIIDYKYGYTYVDENETEQLPFYATCMYEEFKTKHGKELDYVEAVILQPRAGGEIWRKVKFTQNDLENKKKKIFKVGEDVFVHKKLKFKAGSHCRWCPASGVCPEQSQHLQNQSGLALVRQNELPDVEKLSAEQMQRLLLNKDAIDKFLKAVYSYALRSSKSGKNVPGFKVVNGTSKRGWKDEVEEIGAGLVRIGVKEPFRKQEPELKTIGDIEKELKKLGHSGDDAVSVLQPFTKKGTLPEILVPESDPRPSIKTYKELMKE